MRGLQYCRILGGRWHLYPPSTVTNFASVRSKSTSGIKWLWEADTNIQEFYRANLQGSRIGCYEVTFNTTKPIEPNQFQQALIHLQRKTPCLRTCLRTRGDVIWFCQPPELEIDFQVLDEDVITRDVTYQVLEEGYDNPNFGQWRTRLISRESDAVCPIPEVKEYYPHQYDLVFTTHLGLMDGIGAFITVRCLLKLLDDVIEGKSISDEEYSPFSRKHEIPILINRIKENFSQDPNLLKTVERTRPPPDHIPLLLQAFPRPSVSKPTTKHLTHVIEPQILLNFKAKSSEVGVTCNSSLVAVINTAIMELVREKGIIQDTYRISGNMINNLRQLMKPTVTRIYGPFAIALSYTLPVDKNIRNCFWEYAKVINNELHSYLQQGLHLEQKALQEMMDDNNPTIDYVTKLRPANHDYSITNQGDLSSLVPGVGKNVQMTQVRTINTIHNSCHSTYHEILSFRGRCYYTFTYATNYLSDETANVLLDRIISILEDVSHITESDD